MDFMHLVGGWMLVAIFTFIALLFIRAPYGRFTRGGWGPMIDNRLGWILMETVSPLSLTFWVMLSPNELSPWVWLFYGLWVFHYFYRSFVFPFMLKTTNKKMPLSIVLMAVFFNSVNGSLNGYYFGYVNPDVQWSDIHPLLFGLGSALFVIGFMLHFRSDRILIGLRTSSDEGYKIPFGFAYRYVSSPNYLGEIVEWLGYVLLTGSPAALTFWVWTLANLYPRALANHKWYLTKFEDYPKNRKAILPFIH
ncbi:DUF1295 domain-containing protein [bacterium SCSIO 12741]|nr:DUF1295 domain-containing protein [bacterium SCSIO 12741]